MLNKLIGGYKFAEKKEVGTLQLIYLYQASHLTPFPNPLCFVCSLPHHQIPLFCEGGTSIPGIENKVNCDIIVGYKSVYRMCFSMACFFFLFCIIMIRVRSSKDPRGAIQNGYVVYLVGLLCVCFFLFQETMLPSAGKTSVVHVHTQNCLHGILDLLFFFCQARSEYLSVCVLSFWFFKFLVLVGITVGAFFIPDGTFNTGT